MKTSPDNDLEQILDEIEQRAKWRYADPMDCAASADDVPALVKALRRAMDELSEIAESEITALLTSPAETKKDS